MKVEKILQARVNRRTRIARPFSNFFESLQECVSAAELVVSGAIDSRVENLVKRSAIISAVTAIEVYYRDILDFTFRYCAPSFFECHLKQLHPEKFDISDVVKIYNHDLHPYEIVSSAQTFQNAERIDKVFSLFLSPGGLWSAILNLNVRRKDQPESIVTWTQKDLAGLKRTLELRHELVHDPAKTLNFTDETIAILWASAHMVFGSDFILAAAIQANRDPELHDKSA